MKIEEKINHLQEKHFREWIKMRSIVEDEFSQKQTMFCVCGKLATGLHESICRKFNAHINKESANRLKHLI